ncbi:hypothetical protein [Archangium sp. Cb G35]|uniref:hypothetical protein n=1 Tax=Archangium sp. Cb G35 TaxID=1920190 RepID=UPI001E292AEC|nr:hypothetical protein [Archangium sp. Cb G35]
MQVTIHEQLADVVLFMGTRLRAAEAKGWHEEVKLWRYVRMLDDFVRVTGQVYRFEDSLKRELSAERPFVSTRLGKHEGTLAQPAMQLLLESLDETPEPEHKQQVRVLIALINFIAETGQLGEADDFVVNRLDYAPVAIAHFANHEEAQAWMERVAEPPSPVRILIGDEYYQFWYMREANTRGMYRDHPIEPVLESLTARGIPQGTPSFATRAEAETWLTSHPAHPYSFVAIAGEHFFAVHHPRLKRHSLHHVASALAAWEERKRAVEFDTALETEDSSDGAGE